MDRKHFLRAGFLGIAAAMVPLVSGPAQAAIANKIPYDPVAPILYADGIHDDSPAIQAMFNGYTIFDQQGVWAGSLFKNKLFRLEKTVYIPNTRPAIQFTSCNFLYADQQCILYYESADNYEGIPAFNNFSYCCFQTISDYQKRGIMDLPILPQQALSPKIVSPFHNNHIVL